MYRYVAAVLVGITSLGLAVAAYLEFAPLPRYSLDRVEIDGATMRGHQADGRRLVLMMCEGCHFDPMTRALSGKRLTDIPAAFGVFHSANITRDPQFGIGAWSDADLARAIRTGVARDGSSTAPMPDFPRLSDADLGAIIALLRSDDPMVRAVAAASTPARPTLLGKAMVHFVLKPKPYPTRPIVAPPPTDQVAFGRYLALDRLHCYKCHSSDFVRVNDDLPERSAGFFGGGNPLTGATGETVYSANITPDADTGIGAWSDEDFVRALRHGFRRDGSLLRAPMSMYAGMTDLEARALFAYLRTVPPIHNAPRGSSAKSQTAGIAAPLPGGAIYQKYQCVQCHAATGVGQYDLTHAEEHLGSDAAIEAWIRNPSRFVPDVRMPTWEGVIANDEYGPLVAYVRFLGRKASEHKAAPRLDQNEAAERYPKQGSRHEARGGNSRPSRRIVGPPPGPHGTGLQPARTGSRAPSRTLRARLRGSDRRPA